MPLTTPKRGILTIERFPDCSLPVLRPFLRWAGGKQRLLRDLLRLVPADGTYGRYFEPFLGAGSLFFALRPRCATIGDINGELINCYREIARDPVAILDLLNRYKRRHSREFFYRVRAQPLDSITGVERAARFIYLNKAAFNGIYRVNLKGIFNVPFGPTISGLSIPSSDTLTAAGKSLRKVAIRASDFEETIRDAKKGDFVYLDPPYPPMSKTAFFAHYDSVRFGWHQQQRLANAFWKLAKRGCFVMLSNADLVEVRSLYEGCNITKLDTLRWLGSNGDRFSVSEVVVTNYILTQPDASTE